MKPLTTHEEFCLKNTAHFFARRALGIACKQGVEFVRVVHVLIHRENGEVHPARRSGD